MQRCIKDFLRFCLHDDLKPAPTFHDIDWEQLLDFGTKQSIVGVLFYGIKRLKADDATVPQPVLLKWLAAAMAIKRANGRLYANAAEVTRIFQEKFGHRGCILKGQGNALMYPDPYMRTPGDIDLWAAPNAGETTDDVIRLCRRIEPDCVISYHHADVGAYKGTPIELHFHPSFVQNLFYNRRLQSYFDKERESQFNHFVTLPDNLGKICTPTDEFNLVFQLSHVQRHFFYEGIGLRHLIDYYYLLRRGFTRKQRDEYESTVRRLNMRKFASGIMYVMREYFGLETQYILLKPNRRIGEFIMSEVMATGNFGFTDTRFKALKTNNRILGAFFSVVKTLRFVVEFPGEVFFGHAMWILWWHFHYRYKMERIARGE